MIVDQISVFIENRPGTLAEATAILGDAGIDMRALSIADTSDFGVLRVIVNDPKRALELLKKAGFVVSITPVLAVSLADTPGSLAKLLRILSDGSVSVEYAYAFITRKEGNAYVILRVENNDLAHDILAKEGINILLDGSIFGE
ncbi:MAG: ACT domain-containing protein [Synergistaceae bacterium]|jgi:hypothetical protein|nr:ACT domain-containing protein [Synergistaceae bacterium]